MQLEPNGLTRADARAAWAASGLTYSDLTPENLERLRKAIDDALRTAGCIHSSMRATRRPKLNDNPKHLWADIRCRAYYFKDRQAVTFEPGGFVGFAGWASDENVAPILEAFCGWVRELAAEGTSVAA